MISTTKEEYVVAGRCCSQVIYMKQKLNDYGVNLGSVPIRHDHTSAINLIKNRALHSQIKQIEVRNHFILDHVKKG